MRYGFDVFCPVFLYHYLHCEWRWGVSFGGLCKRASKQAKIGTIKVTEIFACHTEDKMFCCVIMREGDLVLRG